MCNEFPRVSLIRIPETTHMALAHYTQCVDPADAVAIIAGDMEAIEECEKYPDKPLILILENPLPNDIQRAYKAGVAECLILPQPLENIVHVVGRIINYHLAIKECRSMEKRYHAALGAIPDLILHFRQGAILIDTYFYPEFPMPFDIRLAVGKRLTEVFPDPIMKTLEEGVNRCIAETTLVDLTYKVNGRYREARISPINHGTNEALILIRDVTDLVLMNKEVSELRSLPAKFDAVIQLADVVIDKINRSLGIGKAGEPCES